jgi:hypothetical protein
MPAYPAARYDPRAWKGHVGAYVEARLPRHLRDCQLMLSVAAPDNPHRRALPGMARVFGARHPTTEAVAARLAALKGASGDRRA